MNRTVTFFVGIASGALLVLLVLFAVGVFDSPAVDLEPEIEKNIAKDTVYIEQKPEVKIQKVVEQVDVPSQDTVMVLTNLNQNVDSSEYIVLRDKLLHTVRVKILNNNKSSSTASDKLIDKMSTDQGFSDHITVEFWESPIDYQGYRLNKTKLILFGINPNESFMLSLNANGTLFMQTGDYATTLEMTDRYRTFTFQ